MTDFFIWEVGKLIFYHPIRLPLLSSDKKKFAISKKSEIGNLIFSLQRFDQVRLRYVKLSFVLGQNLKKGIKDIKIHDKQKDLY